MQIKTLSKSILMVALCLFVVNTYPLYAQKPQKAPKDKKLSPAEENKKLQADINSLQEKNNTLTQLYGELKADRDNLLTQSKRLLEENRQYTGLKASIEGLNQEKSALTENQEAIKRENAALASSLEELKIHLSALVKEKSRLDTALSEANDAKSAKESTMRTRLEKEYQGRIVQVPQLKAENVKLINQINNLRQDVKILEAASSRYKEENALLESRLVEIEKSNKELSQENLQLVDEARSFPIKFADLARQNKQLINETADIHYNLGVFYVNNKEYKRAIQEFGKTLKLRPEDAQANYNLGYLYAEHLVDRAKAIQYFQKYLTYAPNATDADWVRKYLLTWETWYGKEIR